MAEHHSPHSISALLLFSVARFVQRAHSALFTHRKYTIPTSTVLQKLHCNSTVHTDHPSDFCFIQGLLPEDNLQIPPILLPMVLPHVPTASTQYSWNSFYLWSFLYYAWFSACSIQSYMGRSCHIMECWLVVFWCLLFSFYDYDSSVIVRVQLLQN